MVWPMGPFTQSRLTRQCRGSPCGCSVKNCRHSLEPVPQCFFLPVGLGPYVQKRSSSRQVSVASPAQCLVPVAWLCSFSLALTYSLSLSTFPTSFCTLFWALSYDYHSNDHCSLSTSVPQQLQFPRHHQKRWRWALLRNTAELSRTWLQQTSHTY